MASWDYNPYNWSYNPTSNLYNWSGVPLCRGVPTPCSSTQKNTKKDPRTKLLLVEEVGDICLFRHHLMQQKKNAQGIPWGIMKGQIDVILPHIAPNSP